MKKDDFLHLVRSNWTAGDLVAAELSLHLADIDDVLGWLCLERSVPGKNAWSDPDGPTNEWFAILTNRFFLITHCQQSMRHGASAWVDSAPMGRLRAVNSYNHGNGHGGFTLDFAGPVFSLNAAFIADRSLIRLAVDGGWPSDEVRAFLTAVTQARR
jgi:hypothetical protein